MIPIRDANPSSVRPWVTVTLLAANVLAFFYQLSLGPALPQFLREFGVVPVDIMGRLGAGEFSGLWPLATSMFLHGGWLHLIGNMLFLWVFGDNVEDRFGHARFLLFYLGGGLAAAAAHVVTNAASPVPTIGASGAVAAVLGAYSYLFPGARVLALVPIGILLQAIELPAKLFLGLWFVYQFLLGSLTAAAGRASAAGGVAWWAHIGGFVFGFAVALVLCRGRRDRRR